MCASKRSRHFTAALPTNSECLAGPFLGGHTAVPGPLGQLYLQHLVIPLLQGLICPWFSSLATAAELLVLYPTEQGNQDERVVLVDGPLILQGQEKKLGSGPISLQGLQALGMHRCLVRPVTYPCKNLFLSAGESWYRQGKASAAF